MLPLVRWMVLGVVAAGMLAAMGCQGDSKYGGNPEGKEAKADKEYTKEDAMSAQPNRGALGRASDGAGN